MNNVILTKIDGTEVCVNLDLVALYDFEPVTALTLCTGGIIEIKQDLEALKKHIKPTKL